jgi:CheY-like chemotaxis protein
VVDDTTLDGDVVAGILRKVLGPEVTITTARSIGTAQDAWRDGQPDLIFLDDRLGPSSSANIHLPQLRRVGFNGPIVVMSGMMTRERRGEMIRLGAEEAVHKDDLVSARVIELLLLLIDRTTQPPPDA